LKPRIHIIGGPGSGKSYIAGKLAARLGVPVCNLDDLFWDPAAPRYGVRAEVVERDRCLAEVAAGDGWIIEGVYYQWAAPSFARADVIIVLTPGIWLRHWRVVRRFMLRKSGRLSGKHESLTHLWQLLRWSHAFDRSQLVRAHQFLTEHGHTWAVCKTYDDVLAAIPRQITGVRTA
jgi:adenylate kinase family enzyme